MAKILFSNSSKAQENADEFGNEVDQLRATVARTEEEKQRLELELTQVKEMLQREVGRADAESKRNAVIITEYKQICQRLEDDYNTAKATLSDMRTKIAKCENCSTNTNEPNNYVSNNKSHPLENRVDPVLSRAQERVRELELELAQTKLAHVEAQCKNQDLIHQLKTANSELQQTRNSWLSKTLTSIKEAANKREVMGGTAGGPVSGILRRESAPSSSNIGAEVRVSPQLQTRRDSFRDSVKEAM